MRKIQDLLNADHRVWFYLKDRQTKERFVAELNRLGTTYLNGTPVTVTNCSAIMALHPDLKAAHLMIMIWNASFHPSFTERYMGNTEKIFKVDYAKFSAGEPDYLCHRSPFTPVA